MPASAPPDPPRCTPCAHGSGHTRETAALADSRALAHVVSGRSSRGEAVAPFDLGAVGISRRRRAILLRVRRRRVQQHDDHREGGPIHVPPHQKKRTVPRHARVRRSGRRALRNCRGGQRLVFQPVTNLANTRRRASRPDTDPRPQTRNRITSPPHPLAKKDVRGRSFSWRGLWRALDLVAPERAASPEPGARSTLSTPRRPPPRTRPPPRRTRPGTAGTRRQGRSCWTRPR